MFYFHGFVRSIYCLSRRFSVGTIGPASFGLGVRDSCLVIVGFNLICAILPAYLYVFLYDYPEDLMTWNLQRYLGLEIRDAADDSSQIYLRVSMLYRLAEQCLIISTKVLWCDPPMYSKSFDHYWVLRIGLYTWWASIGQRH